MHAGMHAGMHACVRASRPQGGQLQAHQPERRRVPGALGHDDVAVHVCLRVACS